MRLSLLLTLMIAMTGGPLARSAESFITVTQNAQGGWHFVKDGKPFHSMGICHMAAQLKSRDGKGRTYDGVKIHGTPEAWAASSVDRLTQWGFTTAGAWCDESVYARPVPHTRSVWLSAEVDGISQRLMNVFSPGYEKRMDELCAEFVAPHKDNPWLIGWYLDNELPWFGEHGWPTDPHLSLLDYAFKLPAADPNRLEAVKVVQAHYGADHFDAFQREWETAASSWDDLRAGGVPRAKSKLAEQAKQKWAGHVAERFFTVNIAAVRRHDPHHLILGCRFAGDAPGPVLAVCAKHSDVVSINRYSKDGTADIPWWDRLYALTQKPLLITEFSWRAMENRSGNLNTRGVDVTVATQQERGERYRKHVPLVMARPYMLGMHWFEWADGPENGRFDGENSNYGLVDWEDHPYEELVSAIKTTNAALPPPATRSGPLPAAADQGGLVWNLRLASLPAGKLAAPVELATADAQPTNILDHPNGTQVSASRDGKNWRAEYDSGTGWGFNLNWPATGKAMAGADRLRLVYEAAQGTNLSIMLFEDKTGDGECWVLGPFQATGKEETVEIDLREASVNPYSGNQQGNRRIDLDTMSEAGLFLGGKQGTGTVRVSSLSLLE